MQTGFKIHILALLMLSGINSSKAQVLSLNPLLSDHAVLQQKSKVAIWGTSAPNQEVTVVGSWGKKAKTTSNQNGSWMTTIKTPKAGGPYQLTITSGIESRTISDIMMGEVWLCSGQSNMEMPMKGFSPQEYVEDSKEDISKANYPTVRMFTVKRNLGVSPHKDLEGDWRVCTPETAGDFSATAFYFGRKLHQNLNVPIGLIHSSWGGTPAEAWTPVEYVEEFEEFKGISDNLPILQSQEENLNKWLDEKPTIEENMSLGEDRFKDMPFNDIELSTKEFNDSDWASMNAPMLWEKTAMRDFDGIIWFRKKIKIPSTWKNKTMVVELSSIDDMDWTFVNGHQIGATDEPGFWQAKRRYEFSSDLLFGEENIISVRILDNGGGGGFWGEAKEMRLYPKGEEINALSLAGDWKYLPIAEYKANKFYMYGIKNNVFNQRPKLSMAFNSHTPAVLYNGMIAPIIPYAIKGAIWYQGESNVGREVQYKSLFPTMIEAWRKKWNNDFSFYFAQIAPYTYSGENNRESAALRFAQNQCLSLPKTGQAVLLDIGSMTTIHPSNKKEVGERLARWALAKDYSDKTMAYSGPICTSAKQTGNEITLQFNIGASKLVASKSGLSEFELVYENGNSIDAKADITNNMVILTNTTSTKPVAVRYAWKNGSNASLFNSAGLPASTFYIEVK